MKKRRFTAIIRVRACNTFVFFKKFNKKKLQHNISFHYQSFSPDNCPVLLRFSVTRFVLSFKIPQLLSPPQHIPHTYIGVFWGSFLFFLFFSNKITLPSAQQNEGLASFARDKTGKFLTGSHTHCCPKFLTNTLATQTYKVKYFFSLSLQIVYTQRKKYLECTYF